MNEIVQRIKELTLEHLKLVNSIEQINSDSELVSLGMDSMSATNLMIDIEDEYDIVFPDEALTPEVFRSPETLGKCIYGLLN